MTEKNMPVICAKQQIKSFDLIVNSSTIWDSWAIMNHVAQFVHLLNLDSKILHSEKQSIII